MRTAGVIALAFLCTLLPSTFPAIAVDNELPIVADGFAVEAIATEPLVSNPCVLAFDSKGRICVAQGPQWRGPTPETPGDRIDILTDSDGNGTADHAVTFAEGFNSIQGIAWHGNDLWVANAPDLTVVRDTDGNDQADVYIRVYTGLGNLEHSLHGLNFGPDGKLYMSKGNSKGYNRLDQLAPRAFRELWGLASPRGAPDYTPVEYFGKDDYQRSYHTPQDDWGQQGGILRCDPYLTSQAASQIPSPSGRNLEIFSRGFRNPWDICFDDQFNWLGTDNDQTEGDRVFSPFFGAHFGWGHPWSFHWRGVDHLPTVPISMPLFEGSGTGVVHYHAAQFPPEYQRVFFVNDWMRREIYLFKPEWRGALLHHSGNELPSVFAHAGGGRSLPSSSGIVFDPTDIEVGPDGALYVLSWGHGYGATFEGESQVDAGRVYRIRYANRPLGDWQSGSRDKPHSEWSVEHLVRDLGSSIPCWRVNAQNELIRRGEAVVPFLQQHLNTDLTDAQQTWAIWTLGRLSIDALLESAAIQTDQFNVHLQTLRILAQEDPNELDPYLAWESQNARLRHASVQAIWQSNRRDLVPQLISLAAREQDRVVYYSTWNALRGLLPTDQLKQLTGDPRPRIRLAALLGLFLDDAITAAEVLPFRTDSDSQVAELVEQWLMKTGNASPLVVLDPPPGSYPDAIAVTAKSGVPGSFMTYTTDGSAPAITGERVNGPIVIDQDTELRISIFQQNLQAGAVTKAEYRVQPSVEYRHRTTIRALNSDSGNFYELDWTGIAPGKRHYTDRNYRILEVPAELQGLPFLRTANQDDRRITDTLLEFHSDTQVEILIGLDTRIQTPPVWMCIGDPEGFRDTEFTIKTTDPTFRVFSKTYPAGTIKLGCNLNNAAESPRGNYIVLFRRRILNRSAEIPPVQLEQVLAALPTADPERGRELFLHPDGAGCFKCHRMQGIGQVLAPDLTDIGDRVKSPQVLIESILDPSRVITEGFAQQKVLTVDGRVLSGSVLEETGRSLRLATSEGTVITVAKSDIEARTGTHLSPMPDGFGTMMTAQQVADLTSWLMTQRINGDRAGFWFQESTDNLKIYYKKQRIATYIKRHPLLTRRALVNVTTPSGIQLTRNFPPRKPDDIDPGYSAEDGIIHPIMHPGIWLSFGDISGNDYWRLQAEVEFDGYVSPPTGDSTYGEFSTRNSYWDEDHTRVICEEIMRYHFELVPEGLAIQFNVSFLSDDQDFYFGDQEESGLAVRVASPIRVQGGNGTILNHRGERNGAEVWGKEADWFDYYGTIADRNVGIMVIPSPQNTRTSWLHARDYGVVVTNPFPKQPKERREPYVKTPVERGSRFELSYIVLLHESSSDSPFDRAASAERLKSLFSRGSTSAP